MDTKRNQNRNVCKAMSKLVAGDRAAAAAIVTLFLHAGFCTSSLYAKPLPLFFSAVASSRSRSMMEGSLPLPELPPPNASRRAST